MSKNNYNKHYKPGANNEEFEVKTSIEQIEEEPAFEEETVIEPEVVEPEPKKVLAGVISGCKKLNIRKTAAKDGEVAAVLEVDTDVSICIDDSTKDFYKVSTLDGVEGYCMKEFVTLL